MDTAPGIDTPQSPTPGTLEEFHLGLAADGTSCAMVFVDERKRSIACVARFSDLNGFILSLTRAAAEMARRRARPLNEDAPGDDSLAPAASAGSPDARVGAFTVASSDFKLCSADGGPDG